jgi:hypothetical protein
MDIELYSRDIDNTVLRKLTHREEDREIFEAFMDAYNRRFIIGTPSRGYNPNFLVRSLLLYKDFPVNRDDLVNWNQENTGLLMKTSVNCKFTIGEYLNKYYFIKVVNLLSDVEERHIDCIIFDIINGLIFLMLPRNDRKMFISNFIDANYSYLTSINDGDRWDYRLLMDMRNPLSPLQLDVNKAYSEIYINDRYIYSTEAFKNCDSVGNIFYKIMMILLMKPERYNEEIIYTYTMNQTVIRMNLNEMRGCYTLFMTMLLKLGEFYEFLENIAFKYNFLHNDLHMSNLLCKTMDDNEGKMGDIKMIDFGRSSFGHFMNNPNIEIDRNILFFMNKLNITDVYMKMNIQNFISTYLGGGQSLMSVIYNYRGENNMKLFRDNISMDEYGCNKYICMDVIALSLSIYQYLSLYTHIINELEGSLYEIPNIFIYIKNFIDDCRDFISLEFRRTINIDNLNRTNNKIGLIKRYGLYKFALGVDIYNIFDLYIHLCRKIRSYSSPLNELFESVLDGILFVRLLLCNEAINTNSYGIDYDEGRETLYVSLGNNSLFMTNNILRYRNARYGIEEKLNTLKDIFQQLSPELFDDLIMLKEDNNLFKPYLFRPSTPSPSPSSSHSSSHSSSPSSSSFQSAISNSGGSVNIIKVLKTRNKSNIEKTSKMISDDIRRRERRWKKGKKFIELNNNIKYDKKNRNINRDIDIDKKSKDKDFYVDIDYKKYRKLESNKKDRGLRGVNEDYYRIYNRTNEDKISKSLME